MFETLDFYFEIEYLHERAGWLTCYVNFGQGRHKLRASDVFPPFMQMLRWLKAITLQRLPHKFYWDEEGQGVFFEAWPIAPDSPRFRLRVKHDLEEVPWVEGTFSREEVVNVFLPALRVFASHQQPTRGTWEIRPEDISELIRWHTRHIPSRNEITSSEPLLFIFRRPQIEEGPAQWLEWQMWGMPLINWLLEDHDPFWDMWFALLARIAVNDLPAQFLWLDRQVNASNREMVELGEFPETALERLWSMTVHAEPLPHPDYFRLIITETNFWYENFPVLDEVLDRRQLVQGFCEAFERFLQIVITHRSGRGFSKKRMKGGMYIPPFILFFGTPYSW